MKNSDKNILLYAAESLEICTIHLSGIKEDPIIQYRASLINILEALKKVVEDNPPVFEAMNAFNNDVCSQCGSLKRDHIGKNKECPY